MKLANIFTVITICGLLASCTSRNTAFTDEVSAEESSNWHVHDIEVIVPDSLTTTDINIFQPDVDIVWHGDLPGDRKEQVAVILHDALEAAAAELIPENEHRPVMIQATLIQFHSLTPRARAITGGVHKVSFTIQVVDQKTGEVLAGPTEIQADEFAYGGSRAVQAEAEGQTMKVRISNRIAEVVADWLGLVSEEDAVELGRILSIGR